MVTMLALVAAGLGAALVPRSMRHLGMEGVAFRPLLDDTPLVELYATWPRERRSSLIDELLLVIEDNRLAAQIGLRSAEAGPPA